MSVIVAATGAPPSLPRCLAAINTAIGLHDELIVIRDAPRPGPASGRNHGARDASGAVLVFVDADVEIRPDALARIRRRFAADSELAAVFGSYDDSPEERDVVSTFRNLLHHYVHQGARGKVNSFWAGLGAVRRSSFEHVGGFDTRIARASVEDIELGARLAASPGRIELDPDNQGKHLKHWTLPAMVRTDLRQRGIPWTRLAVQGRATRCSLNLAWRHRLSAATSVLILLSLTRRQATAATASFGLLCTLNRRFYRLLAVRGHRYLFAGIALHVIHHLTSALALVVGVAGLPADNSPVGRSARER
jgi:hypothetical protein